MRHAKTVTIADPTQAELNQQIIAGNFPPGTTLEDISLASDWNNYHVVVVDTQSGTTYTLQLSDYGKILRFTSNSAITLTCPNSLPAGFNVGIFQIGSGAITPTAASGAVINNRQSHTQSAGQYAECNLAVHVNSDGSSANYLFGGDTA